MNEALCQHCVNTLKRELLPAMGCTEPISVALAAAIARKTLNALPERVEIYVSGNILKNVKSVVVPNTGGLRGVAAAAAAGIVAGNPEKELEVLTEIDSDRLQAIRDYLNETAFSVEEATNGCVFDIGIRAHSRSDEAYVRIEGYHTNVVCVEKNGKSLVTKELLAEGETEKDPLSVADIYEFATKQDLAEVKELLTRQLSYNLKIAEEGLRGNYGARVGKTLLGAFGNDVHNRARAYAAAGSDARMNGCPLPVVIVSGSGNQGMTASLPVYVYAEHLNADEETLLRALCLSDLITIHLKSGIGRLSAYCGAVSAGCGAAAGVSYLYGGTLHDVEDTLINALAIDSGIVCDGAKSSCAAKIASAVDAGLVGFELSRGGSRFDGGDGIVESEVERTIRNVGELASKGMRQTDEEIIRLMIKSK